MHAECLRQHFVAHGDRAAEAQQRADAAEQAWADLNKRAEGWLSQVDALEADNAQLGAELAGAKLVADWALEWIDANEAKIAAISKDLALEPGEPGTYEYYLAEEGCAEANLKDAARAYRAALAKCGDGAE